MNGIIYKNTKTTIPNFSGDLHITQSRGYAYEAETHFVHIYGKTQGVWVISTGLTVTEKKSGTLEDWVINTFGAEDIQQSNSIVGETYEKLWRPGLLYHNEISQGLNISEVEQRDAEQALRILINKLDEILLFIQPEVNGLQTYSHKTRELLILACTEVENSWTKYLKESNTPPIRRYYNTNDYFKLCETLSLKEFQIELKIKCSINSIIPYDGWDSSNTTGSLVWYDSYNKTKHDRDNHFDKATLENCIKAITANIVMFCVRFSPYPLWNSQNSTSSIFNQFFDISLSNPDPTSFYIPEIDIQNNQNEKLNIFDAEYYLKPRTVNNLII